MSEQLDRKKILSAIEQYAKLYHCPGPFVPGITSVPVSGKVYDSQEMTSLAEAVLDFWLTTGRFDRLFVKELSSYLGAKHVLTVNSGSSANLLAVATLCSPLLEEKALRPGDEVITVASGFPTTVNPLLLYQLVPVFVDIDIPTYNINITKIEKAITPKTKAIVLAHTLGNPFDIDGVLQIARKYNLWLIEDCCDALGSRYNDIQVGNFGHLATLSFYPAHHITTGEGGAVYTNSSMLNKIAESIRDWGRDCFCDTGCDNSCGKRFDQQLGDLPYGYDHKYTYSELGYNLKFSDMQAAIGLAQIKKINEFASSRYSNYKYLHDKLSVLERYIILPQDTKHSVPSWFGFPITLIHDQKYKRNDLLKFLDRKKIGTRLLFGGNLTKQPYFKYQNYRIHEELKNTDIAMTDSFWVGVYPGLSRAMLDYIAMQMKIFFGVEG